MLVEKPKNITLIESGCHSSNVGSRSLSGHPKTLTL